MADLTIQVGSESKTIPSAKVARVRALFRTPTEAKVLSLILKLLAGEVHSNELLAKRNEVTKIEL